MLAFLFIYICYTIRACRLFSWIWHSLKTKFQATFNSHVGIVGLNLEYNWRGRCVEWYSRLIPLAKLNFNCRVIIILTHFQIRQHLQKCHPDVRTVVDSGSRIPFLRFWDRLEDKVVKSNSFATEEEVKAAIIDCCRCHIATIKPDTALLFTLNHLTPWSVIIVMYRYF